MSAIDPNVSNLSEDALLALSTDTTTFTMDGPSQTGEQFIFALALEGRNPNTCPFAERLFFPVNPEEFSFTQTRAVGTYDLIGGPQMTQLGQMQVRVWQISSLFPESYEDDYCIPYPAARLERNPQQAIWWLQQAQMAGYPLQFMSLPLRNARSVFGNVKVVISSVTSSLRAGSPTDVWFDLELTELKEPTIIKTAATTIAGPTWKFKKHVTTKGETLADIARKAYGTQYGGLWTQIRAKNKVVIYPKGVKKPLRQKNGKPVKHSNEALLVGQHLVIPQPKSQPR